MSFSFYADVVAQTNEEKAVADVLRQNATAFAKNDMDTMKKIWVMDESLTIFESGHANYGWADYRDNHLGPEMKEIKNTKYEFSEIKAKVSGNMAYATMKYTISGDSEGKHFDGAGLATAVLEKSGGNKSRAAELLRMKRSTLVSKVKALAEEAPCIDSWETAFGLH